MRILPQRSAVYIRVIPKNEEYHQRIPSVYSNVPQCPLITEGPAALPLLGLDGYGVGATDRSVWILHINVTFSTCTIFNK